MFSLRAIAGASRLFRTSTKLPVRAMSTAPKEMTIRDAINSALDEEMERDAKVFVIGAVVSSLRRTPFDGGCARCVRACTALTHPPTHFHALGRQARRLRSTRVLTR